VTEVAGRVKKEDRIRRLIPTFEQQRFYFPVTLHYVQQDGKTIDLVEELQREILSFPEPDGHDDMVDSLARIYEPDLPLTFPLQDEDEFGPRDRYARDQWGSNSTHSAWAA
jgi:hypothetical protein